MYVRSSTVGRCRKKGKEVKVGIGNPGLEDMVSEIVKCMYPNFAIAHLTPLRCSHGPLSLFNAITPRRKATSTQARYHKGPLRLRRWSGIDQRWRLGLSVMVAGLVASSTESFPRRRMRTMGKKDNRRINEVCGVFKGGIVCRIWQKRKLISGVVRLEKRHTDR